MRFGIIGTGAMGGLFAGHLCANDEAVCCLDVDESIVSSIQQNGLYVERPERPDLKVYPEISTSPEELGSVDVAFVLTKSFDTEEAINRAGPMIQSETQVVTVQNGLKNVDILERHHPPERVLGGYTRTGANTIEPGRVRMLTTEETVIGGSSTETVQNIANRLTEAGIRTEVCGDAEPYIWDKQFLNVAVKPIAALTELRNGPMIEYPETREIMRRLVEEAVTVAKGMDVEILSDDPVGDVINRDLSEAGKDKKSSILEDVENERPTEINHINGAVVDYGTEIDVETPYNKMATDLVSGKERGYQD